MNKVGVSQDVMGPQKWFTYQHLQNFVRKFKEMMPLFLLFRGMAQKITFLINIVFSKQSHAVIMADVL